MQYYFDSYSRIWVRRLLKLSDCKIDLSLTSNTDEQWANVRAERIRLHNTADDKGFELVDELPCEAYQAILAHVGEALGTRILGYNYVKYHGMRAIRKASREWKTGGGIPAELIPEFGAYNRVEVLIDMAGPLGHAHQRSECQIVELTGGGYGVLDHGIQTLVAKCEHHLSLAKWLNGSL